MAVNTSKFYRNQVMYSIFVRNYSEEGDFSGVRKDLDRIKALGTDIVWLLPIHPIGKKERKGELGSPYAISDYRKINPEYGTIDDLKQLVTDIHARGMKCIIDVVYNHTSPDSWLAKNHPEWFYHKPDGCFGNKVGEWLDVIDLDYNNRDLWLIGEAVFHMLPVGICWSITKKMGTNQMLGIVLGLTLVSGQLLNAYAVNASAVIPQWDFGFVKVDMIGYQAQVIPAMLAGFTLVYLEKFFRKVTPAVISMIVVPFCSLLLAVMAAHFVLGPIGWTIGSWISNFVYAGITGSLRLLFGAVFGFFYAPLVITGLHHMSNAIDTQLCADFGGTMLWPMIALSNIAQGSAVLGMIYLQRKNARAQEVNIPSCISCYLGVTKPAIFGVNLKYNFPFICAMIGSGIASAFSVMTSSTANSIGVGGLPGILSMQPQSMGTFAIAMLIAIAVPFVLTVIIGKRKNIA